MSDDSADAEKESWVRRRAYQIWQEGGESHGQHDDHWHQAAREYEQAMGTPAETTRTGGDLEQDLIETPPPVTTPEPAATGGPGSEAIKAADTGTELPGQV